MQKQENVFIGKVNKKLDPRVHVDKMSNPFRAGIPDCYYEGSRGILWAEYKWLTVISSNLEPWASPNWPRQKAWLCRAWQNFVHTCVIVGMPKNKGFIVEYPFKLEASPQILTLEKICAYIESLTI